MRFKQWVRLVSILGVTAVCLPAWSPVARGQEAPLTLGSAAGATELPLGPWGLYSRAHSGPCFTASRLLSQVFAFPIVIGQRKSAFLMRVDPNAPLKLPSKPERMALQRRAMGLSPVQAENDDRTAANQSVNRIARIREADMSGLLWRAQVAFAPAEVAFAPPGVKPSFVSAPGTDGKDAAWGAGEASIDYFPAFADPAADGLLIRVTLTNKSDAPQTYYVDLLGGMNSVGEAFAQKDLFVQADPGGDGVVVQHTHCESVFALAANPVPFPVRHYQVGDAYFAPDGALSAYTPEGTAIPAGRIGAHENKEEPGKEKRGKQAKQTLLSESPASPKPPETTGLWGLTRVDDIAIAPGQSVSVFLCVGVGGNADAARDSAQTLLGMAEDATAFGKPREGAYAKALQAHAQARFQSGNPAIDRLMAQSIANVPFDMLRRVGIPSREATEQRLGGAYEPMEGGMIALGWMFARPDWSAVQLNAFFLTRGNPDAPLAIPRAVPPTNLFALWELWQHTHDREMLDRFYPFARRRYRELLAAGTGSTNEHLYAWPEASRSLTAPSQADGDKSGKEASGRVYAPDYSAYVIRAAKIMEALAEQTKQPADEQREYAQDAKEAARALNATLWDSQRGLYVPKAAPGSSAPPITPPDTLGGLLPLIAGTDAQTDAQHAALLKNLTDPAAFWSGAGLRSASKASPSYQTNAHEHSVHFGLNWMLWKALLDCGEAETARKLAGNVVTAYAAAQSASDSCPERLDGDTGAAEGVGDYSGDACAVIPLYAAYHLPGTVSSGWDVQLLDTRYDKQTDALHLVFSAPDASGKGLILCTLGKPNGAYMLSGSLKTEVKADADGVVTFPVPHDAGTMMIDLTPKM